MLHNLFESRANTSPNTPALVFQNKIWTYKQLDEQANQLAHVLLSEGIKPKDHVIARLERSADQVIILLALSKIGAIYVPLSTEQPDTRLEQMVTDCAPKLIITNSAFETKNNVAMPRVFDMRAKANQMTQASVENPQVIGLDPNETAYVAYSSGTTGRPKGIPVKHAGLFKLWPEEMKRHIDHSVSRVLANVGIDFDAHVAEVVLAWTHGAAIYPTDSQTRKDPKLLSQFIVNNQITDITITPTALNALVSDDQVKKFASSGLKGVHSTGEACTAKIVKLFAEHHINLFNLYGPTEATFGLSMILCKLEDFHNGIAPIGIPPTQTGITVKIADEKGQEAPDGQEGELIIYSPYLTEGYLGNVQSNSFFTDNKSGQRGYKTGDKFKIVNGKLYYQGRLNHLSHIKIRGQYVDIPGIENVLRSHPFVQDVCVVVRDDILKEPTLVAFIVYKGGIDANASALKEHCRQLSTASIPVFFPSIEKIPTTMGSDKADRAALEKQAFTYERDASIQCIPAENRLQEELITIWKEVLFTAEVKIDIGITDNFTEIGGNSINTYYLVKKINEKYRIDISIANLSTLNEFTVRGLAHFIQEELTKKDRLKLIKLAKKDRTRPEPLFLLPPISGESEITYAKLIDKLKIPQAIYTLEGLSATELAEKNYSIPELASLYLRSMRDLQTEGPLHIAGWSAGGLLAFEIARQAEAAGTPVAFVGIIDEPTPSFTCNQSPASFAKELAKLMDYFSKKHHFSIEINVSELAKLSKQEQINFVFAKLGHLPEGSKNIMAYVRNFLLATITYQPDILKSTPLTVFTTTQTRQEHTNPNELSWSKWTQGNVIEKNIDGDHFSILEQPQQIAEKISRSAFPLTPLKNAVPPPINDMSSLELDEASLSSTPASIHTQDASTPASTPTQIVTTKRRGSSPPQPHHSGPKFQGGKPPRKNNRSPSYYSRHQEEKNYPPLQQQELQPQQQLQQQQLQQLQLQQQQLQQLQQMQLQQEQETLHQLMLAQMGYLTACQATGAPGYSLTMLQMLTLTTNRLTAVTQLQIQQKGPQPWVVHPNPMPYGGDSYSGYPGTFFSPGQPQFPPPQNSASLPPRHRPPGVTVSQGGGS